LLNEVDLLLTSFNLVLASCHSVFAAADEACSASDSKVATAVRDYSAILARLFGSESTA